jgi:hypothetical protein
VGSRCSASIAPKWRKQKQSDGGTADVVDVWIMLEYVPAWTAKALRQRARPDDESAWLKRLSDEVVARN